MHELFHGGVFLVLSAVITYYFYLIRDRLKQDKDLATTRFYLTDATTQAFRSIALVFGGYAAAMLLFAVNFVAEDPLGIPDIVLELGYTLGGAGAMLGVIWFQHSILAITSPPEEDM